MYNELREDLKGHFEDHPKTKSLMWGAAIKKILEERKLHGNEMTVKSLSQKTSINDKHLLNIMAGRVKDPPSEKLLKISDALGISYTELAERALGEWRGSFSVCGFGKRGSIEYPQHGFSIQTLTPPGTNVRDFFVGVVTIKAFKELKKWTFRDDSMIFIFVETGTLEITFGNRVRKIHANESVYFDGGVPHKLRNIDSIDARLFLVTRPPIH